MGVRAYEHGTITVTVISPRPDNKFLQPRTQGLLSTGCMHTRHLHTQTTGAPTCFGVLIPVRCPVPPAGSTAATRKGSRLGPGLGASSR